jgi:hypothetical protein
MPKDQGINPRTVSRRIRFDQDTKLAQLSSATNTSINSWVQKAVDKFIEVEYRTRLDNALKLEKSLR